MQSSVFTLPEDRFTAGHSREFYVNSYTTMRAKLDISQVEVSFALAGFLNPGGTPLVRRPAEKILNLDGTSYRAKAVLLPEDTVDLDGKYIYQFTFTDEDGNTYIGKGTVLIDRNIDKPAIAGRKE